MYQEKHYRQWMPVLVVLLTLIIILPLVGPLSAGGVRSSEAYFVHLPLVTGSRGLVLQEVGVVNQPTDILDTVHGLLVAESNGRILNLRDNTPFLDLTVRDEIIGLQSLAYRDDQLYTMYVVLGEERIKHVSRFTVRGAAADLASEEVLFTYWIPQDAVHLGGEIVFGPDGYLYIASGDGSPQGDPDGHAQDTSNLYGSIVRIDVDGGSTGAPDCGDTGNYTIPASNPFVDGAGGTCDELWAIGLRQPWRISFDRQLGDLWISDVGLQRREEVNFQTASSPGGENYGWNCYEGSLPFIPANCSAPTQPPIYEYEYFSGRKCAVIGGYPYRGSAIPSLVGQYVFADFCSGELYAFDKAMNKNSTLLKMEGAQWTTFGEALDGELFVADYGSGKIYGIGGS